MYKGNDSSSNNNNFRYRKRGIQNQININIQTDIHSFPCSKFCYKITSLNNLKKILIRVLWGTEMGEKQSRIEKHTNFSRSKFWYGITSEENKWKNEQT